MTNFFATPMLTLALAMVAGVCAQALARRARLPGLVLLLILGVLLGPDVSGFLQPQALGTGLHAIVGFGVAVVLFEGGLNQDIGQLRKAAAPIRRLVTLGALITAAGGATCAHLFLGWDWRVSVVFGTLVIVTGPTVITPLLRRIKVTHRVETVLEAEGIFIDAVGAIIAVTAFEFALNPGIVSLGSGVIAIAGRIALGCVVGMSTGYIMIRALHAKLIPDGLENIFALSVVILTFEVSNAIFAESGIAAAIACGMLVGHSRVRVLGQLMDFKEQLTVLVVAVLFVLLAADVRMSEVTDLGLGGVLTVAVLMCVVRPINVFVCTRSSDFTIRERLFLSWIAPRGIVAAAMASFFAHELAAHGIPGGNEIRALVFLVIASTVTFQGLSGQAVADLLGVSRARKEGVAIIGANALARRIAAMLKAHAISVTLIDSNQKLTSKAKKSGLRVVTGNALKESTLARAKIDSCAGVLCLTTSEKLNFMVSQLIAHEHKGPDLWLAIADDPDITADMLNAVDMRVFTGQPQDFDWWELRCRKDEVEASSWRWQTRETSPNAPELAAMPTDVMLPVLIVKDEIAQMTDASSEIVNDTRLDLLIPRERAAQARQWLEANGFQERQPSDTPTQA